jgi:16S rRNA G966 N2-methylase RsmD
MDYEKIIPITEPIAAARQSAKRHYGVHPYFTRRPSNVVRAYILNYTREGDRVLDPFGGSGVTAIEAFLENRTGIQNDINPLANFIARGIADLEKGNLSEYRDAIVALEGRCATVLDKLEKSDPKQIDTRRLKAALPRNVLLPENSDARYLFDLFEPSQLYGLGVLRFEIQRLPQPYVRNAMLLALSATITKLNRTFLSAEGRAESRGGSSIFSIYRYKVAKAPVKLPLWQTFRERAENVVEAKAEIAKLIELKKRQPSGWHGSFEVLKSDVTDLPKVLREKVDYIFTDPPYGGHIAYLDLSTMWNAWLNILPSRAVGQKELIVGGDERHTEEAYIRRLGESVRASVAVLKPNRWMSIVFQHWNIAYFHAILASAAESGADLRAAVSQIGDPIWSMHKKKGSESVLAGEMILTFFNTGKPIGYETGRTIDLECEVQALTRDCEGPLYGEYLLNRIVLKAWERGATDSLNLSKEEFARILGDAGWRYSQTGHYWVKAGQQVALL